MDCGVVGIYGHPEAANLTYLGLHALQHRGQESAGIVSSDGRSFHMHRGLGWVSAVFTPEILCGLAGEIAIGHNRYSTAGGKEVLTNAQPLLFNDARCGFALAHNGNLVNAVALQNSLEAEGVRFETTADTEVIGRLIVRGRQKEPFAERVITALSAVKGAYSLLLLTTTEMIAVRDPHGFRPLVLGELDGAIVVASETCALDIMGASYTRDIAPGEVLVVSEEGIESRQPFPPVAPVPCVFEQIYFARPDSMVEGRSAYDIRRAYGRKLAREHPAAADVVIPVPDSGVPAALGYAEESGLPFQMGLIRSHYVGRTFIEPKQEIRDAGVRLKFNPERSVLAGQRVVVVDDSIVRGTTSRKLVRMVRRAGAREVHVRISSPPMTGPCHYGIDTPNRDELIAASSSVEQIQHFLEADSLGYLSIAGLHAVTRAGGDGLCDACFSGRYPVAVKD